MSMFKTGGRSNTSRHGLQSPHKAYSPDLQSVVEASGRKIKLSKHNNDQKKQDEMEKLSTSQSQLNYGCGGYGNSNHESKSRFEYADKSNISMNQKHFKTSNLYGKTQNKKYQDEFNRMVEKQTSMLLDFYVYLRDIAEKN